ncbi:MAG TPA: hypothetical protein VG797_11200, partial [Phycisphaerales bacterium]|nr:hypothetical protein [Phycisphaerales bacterium]
MAFNLFKKKDSAGDGAANGSGGGGDAGTPGSGGGADTGGFQPQPEKARRFFEHARTVFEASNYEYSMTLWLQGLRMDPTDMQALENFFKTCAVFLDANPKAKGPTKDQLKGFSGKGPIEKFLLALLNWGTRPTEWQLGVRAMEAASEMDLAEAVYWIGERVLRRATADPKAKKADYVAMKDAFSKVGAFDKAVTAGDLAAKLDPTDQKLAAEMRNMSAQATIARGGYETSGQAGGFRKNIKDLAGQTAKEEDERLTKSEETLDRVVERARADYESRPQDSNAIQKYAKLLMERGRVEDERLAYRVLMKGFEEVRAYKFREAAGDIRMRIERRTLREREEALKKAPEDQTLKSEVEALRKAFVELEAREYADRVANYPTNLDVKYEYGRRLLELWKFDEAIEQFQQAQGAPGIASQVNNALATCFLRMGWLDEAEATYRRGLETHVNHNDALGLELRYGLMDALDRKARDTRDVGAA